MAFSVALEEGHKEESMQASSNGPTEPPPAQFNEISQSDNGMGAVATLITSQLQVTNDDAKVSSRCKKSKV